jgi:peptidyl-prolyl cis-trans isomerase SurA
MIAAVYGFQNIVGLPIVNSRLKDAQRSWWLKPLLFAAILLAYIPSALAQSVVVMVNDDPITSYDVAQREHFLALTSGFGDKMRARLESDQTKKAFQAYMMQHNPQSREEAQKLQKEFVNTIQKEVVASASSAKRQEAMEQLIEEKLMLQAAKAEKITIPDADVDKVLTRMAEGGQKKSTLKEFLASFQEQGINPSTLRERIRAQTAWRELIRRLYGSRIRAAAPVSSKGAEDNSATKVDVEIVKLAMPDKADQKAVARRLVEAEQLRKKFNSCANLVGQTKSMLGVTVQSLKKAGEGDFSGEVWAAVAKAKPGEMTPPVITGAAIQLTAVCSKTVPATLSKTEQKAEAQAQDQVQEEFQLYSRRHLKDLKDRALLKYPKSG